MPAKYKGNRIEKAAVLKCTVILAVAPGGAAGSSDALAPDVVFHNGKIATVNAEFEMVEAVAVHDGRTSPSAPTTASAPWRLMGRDSWTWTGKPCCPGSTTTTST